MTDYDDINEIIEIDFEVGHTSTIRSEPTTNHKPPRTHDWKVYLRAADIGADLTRLIKRCVFHLHPDFPDHKRELRTTPFAIHETGYAGFPLAIDIFFNTKNEPKKHRIDYDLDLHTNVEGGPFRQQERYRRTYRYTFCDPDPEFREKILAAGGKIKQSKSLPTKSNETSDNDDEEKQENEQTTTELNLRPPSPPAMKRPFSPAPTATSSAAKKIKTEPTITHSKKKQSSQTILKNDSSTKITTNAANTKKINPNKTSPIIDEKSNKPSMTTENLDDSVTKIRSSTKLKTESEVKTSVSVVAKKKETLTSPTKKNNTTLTNKAKVKVSLKPETTSSNNNKSPTNLPTKLEASPNTNSSNSTAGPVSISGLKKIPKKVIPPAPVAATNEKRVRSSISPSSSNRNSDRSSQRHSSTSSKNSKGTNNSNSSTNNTKSIRTNNNNNTQSEKHASNSASNTRARSRSRSRSRSTQHSSRSSHHSSRHSSEQKDRSSRTTTHHHHHHHRRKSPSRSTGSSKLDPKRSSSNEPSSINTPQSRPDSVEAQTNNNSPIVHVFQSEDDHTQTPMDIDGQTDDDETHHRRTPVPSMNKQRIFQSDHSNSLSDTNESNTESELSLDDEEEDLPTVLTDEVLRVKLIYIYKRFTSNSNQDLKTFVNFFKRHQLIDTTNLTMNKSNDGMFTYDLFSLSPLLIGELANDLGYVSNNNVNFNEQ